MCGNADAHGLTVHTDVLTFKEVAYHDIAGQIQFREVHVDSLFLVVGVVDGNGSFVPVECFNVFNEDVATIHLVCDISLQSQIVLVEGNEFFVLHERKCISLDVVQVAADKQGRAHDAPHAEVCLVFFFGQSAAHFQHVHIVVVSVAGVSR